MSRLSFAPPHLLDMPFAANGIPRVPLEPNIISALTGGGDLSTDFTNWDHSKDAPNPQYFGNVQYDWNGPIADDGEIWGIDAPNNQIVRSSYGTGITMVEIARITIPTVVTGFGTLISPTSNGSLQLFRVSPTRIALLASKESGYAGSGQFAAYLYFATWNGTTLSNFTNETVLNYSTNSGTYPVMYGGFNVLKVTNDFFIIGQACSSGYWNCALYSVDVRTGTPVIASVYLTNPNVYSTASVCQMNLRFTTATRFVVQQVGDLNTSTPRTVYSLWDISAGPGTVPVQVGTSYTDPNDTASGSPVNSSVNMVAFPDGRVVSLSVSAAALSDFMRVFDASTGAFTLLSSQYLPTGNSQTLPLFGMIKLNQTDFLVSRFTIAGTQIQTNLGRLRADNSIAWLASAKPTTFSPSALPNGGTGSQRMSRGGPGLILPGNRVILQQQMTTTTPSSTTNNVAYALKAA